MLKNTKYKASKKEIIAASIMEGGTLLSQFHAFLRYKFPNIATKKVDIFLKPGFSMPLQIQWYIKMIIDPLIPTSTLFLLAYFIKERFPKLFYIAMIYAIYNTMDIILFAWNYKYDDAVYNWMLILSTLATIFILLSKNKRLKKV